MPVDDEGAQVGIPVGGEEVGQILARVGNVTSSLDAILLSFSTSTPQSRNNTAAPYLTKTFLQPRNLEGL